MRACNSKADAAENTGHKGYIGIHKVAFTQHSRFIHPGDQKEGEDIRFSLFQCTVLLLQGRPYCSFTIDGLVKAQSVCHFMVHNVFKKCIKGYMFALLFSDQHIADGQEDLFELVADSIFQLQFSGAFAALDPLIIGQVDGNGLAAGITVSCIIDYIIGSQIGITTGDLLFVYIRNWKALLHLRKN